MLLSLFQVSRIFAPNFWGWLADHTNKRARWIKLASFIGCVGYLGIFWADSFFMIFLVMMSMSLFTSSTIPLAESLTLSHMASTNGSYSNIRLWGSVGFIIASFFFGILIDRYSVIILIWALLFIQLIILFLSFSIPDKKFELISDAKRSIWKILKKREVIALLLGCALMVSSHGLLYNFYSIFLKEQNYSSSLIGILWSIGVIFEIIVFMLMPKILSKLNGKTHYLISSVCISYNGSMIWNYTDKAALTMKNMSQEVLSNYLLKIKDEDLYAYNVYQIEGEGRKLFSKIQGDENTIMGLPINQIKKYLTDFKKNI